MSNLSSIASYPLPTVDQLPTNKVQWVLDPRKSALLIHDMQRYFLAPFHPSVADPLVNNCKRLREQCSARNIPVFYTAQPGDMTEQQRGLLNDFWGSGMRSDPLDSEIIEALDPGPEDRVFTKWRYSAFVRSNLLRLMQELGRNQLIICGVYAHIGVLVTSIEAFSHDIQPFLVADAIGDFSAKHHRMALDYAANRCAMVTITEDTFL